MAQTTCRHCGAVKAQHGTVTRRCPRFLQVRATITDSRAHWSPAEERTMNYGSYTDAADSGGSPDTAERKLAVAETALQQVDRILTRYVLGETSEVDALWFIRQVVGKWTDPDGPAGQAPATGSDR